MVDVAGFAASSLVAAATDRSAPSHCEVEKIMSARDGKNPNLHLGGSSLECETKSGKNFTSFDSRLMSRIEGGKLPREKSAIKEYLFHYFTNK